jgi:voltage-gated potassium channel
MTQQTAETTQNRAGFRFLFFFLLIYYFVSPFLSPYPSTAIMVHASLSIVLFISVYAVEKNNNNRFLAMALMLPVLILYWFGIYEIIPFGRVGSYIMFVLFFLLLVKSFTMQILRSKGINLDLLFATLCLYLILGLLWGSLYALLYELDPGSYAGVLLDSNPYNRIITFNYFSLVTLTTLGYGDITPQTAGAGALCQMEAITGQFYTAVVVAWLVGNFVRKEPNPARNEK